MTPEGRVREALRRWMDTTKMGQREFAGDLKKTQVWLQKVLKGENHVRLRDLDTIADAMRTTASELVRGQDDRYVMELTPSELLVLERLRHRPNVLQAVKVMLNIESDLVPHLNAPTRPKRGRPLQAETRKNRGV